MWKINGEAGSFPINNVRQSGNVNNDIFKQQNFLISLFFTNFAIQKDIKNLPDSYFHEVWEERLYPAECTKFTIFTTSKHYQSIKY